MAEDAIRLWVFLSVLAICTLAERLSPWRVRPAQRAAVIASNLSLGFLGAIAVRVLLPWAAWDVARTAERHGLGLLAAVDVPAPLALVLGYVLLDLAVYAQHRASHRFAWLWRLHAVHHSETHLDASTGLRFHPLEIWLSMLWKVTVVAAIGIAPMAVLVFEVVLNGTAIFNHSNLELPERLESALQRVLVTPRLHRLHHSIDGSLALRNFGFSVPWWDRWFGTLTVPTQVITEALKVGLPGAPFAAAPNKLLGLLAFPFKRNQSLKQSVT